MIFKYFLVSALSLFLFYILLAPKRVVMRKVVILAVIGVMLLFSVMPDLSTRIANAFGVGRGSDFLFYISHMVLFFFAFYYYLKFKATESKMTKIIRHLAIIEAKTPESRSSYFSQSG